MVRLLIMLLSSTILEPQQPIDAHRHLQNYEMTLQDSIKTECYNRNAAWVVVNGKSYDCDSCATDTGEHAH